MISVPEDLTELKERARRDDWHLTFVGSDIRVMLQTIESLRRELKHSKDIIKAYSDMAKSR